VSEFSFILIEIEIDWIQSRRWMCSWKTLNF